MGWQFKANSHADLAGIEGSPRTRSEKIAAEQWQVIRLVQGLSRANRLQFPLDIMHTSESVPDFRLSVAGRLIGVETTRLAVADVEHARSLQSDGFNRTLSISSLYREGAQRRSRQRVIEEGFLTQIEDFGVSPEEHDRIWSRTLGETLIKKTAALARANFDHGHEDWLVLWDKVGTPDWQLEGRLETVRQTLQGYWVPSWFSRVFLQGQYFPWQVMFSKDELVYLGP